MVVVGLFLSSVIFMRLYTSLEAWKDITTVKEMFLQQVNRGKVEFVKISFILKTFSH